MRLARQEEDRDRAGERQAEEPREDVVGSFVVAAAATASAAPGHARTTKSARSPAVDRDGRTHVPPVVFAARAPRSIAATMTGTDESTNRASSTATNAERHEPAERRAVELRGPVVARLLRRR